jgi:hypothetical protein
MTRLLSAGLLALVLVAGGGWWLSQPSGPAPAEFTAGAASAQDADVDISTIVEMALGDADALTCGHLDVQ